MISHKSKGGAFGEDHHGWFAKCQEPECKLARIEWAHFLCGSHEWDYCAFLVNCRKCGKLKDFKCAPVPMQEKEPSK